MLPRFDIQVAIDGGEAVKNTFRHTLFLPREECPRSESRLWACIELSVAKVAILPFDGTLVRISERQRLFFFFFPPPPHAPPLSATWRTSNMDARGKRPRRSSTLTSSQRRGRPANQRSDITAVHLVTVCVSVCAECCCVREHAPARTSPGGASPAGTGLIHRRVQ